MIIAFLAVTAAIALLTNYSRLGKFVIMLSAVPIAVICNILRITATGIFCQYFEGAKVRLFFHDFGGYIFVPIAIALAILGIRLFERAFPRIVPKGAV